jgi:hypothetical protein
VRTFYRLRKDYGGLKMDQAGAEGAFNPAQGLRALAHGQAHGGLRHRLKRALAQELMLRVTERYAGLLRYYGVEGEKIQAGQGHENGDVEQRHRRSVRCRCGTFPSSQIAF